MNAISWAALISIACPMLLHADTLPGRPPKALDPVTIQQYEHVWVKCRDEIGFVVNGWLYRMRSHDRNQLRRVHPNTAYYVLQAACPELLCERIPEPTCVMEKPDDYWN